MLPAVDVPVPNVDLLPKPPLVPPPPNALLVVPLVLAPNPPNVVPAAGAAVPPKSVLLLVPVLPKPDGFGLPNPPVLAPNPVPTHNSDVSAVTILSTGIYNRSFARGISKVNLVEPIATLFDKYKMAGS